MSVPPAKLKREPGETDIPVRLLIRSALVCICGYNGLESSAYAALANGGGVARAVPDGHRVGPAPGRGRGRRLHQPRAAPPPGRLRPRRGGEKRGRRGPESFPGPPRGGGRGGR